MQGQIIYTNKARCRDCYRCLRVCPVDAIKVEDGQASVISEKCILCGTCLKECPQKAKSFRNDVQRVKDLIDHNEKIAISVAPTYSALFSEWESRRFPSLLRRLGFNFVSLTSYAAYFVADETKTEIQHSNGSCLASACPVFVNYVEKYNHENLKSVIPVVSPMIAHSRLLKEKLGEETKIVFAGPCIAKKAEAEREEYEGEIDVVITFDELFDWADEEGIDLKSLEESDFDEKPFGSSEYFPLPGGLLKTANLDTDIFQQNILNVHGIDDIKDLLEVISTSEEQIIAEPLGCAGGCINGVGASSPLSGFEKRKNLLKNCVRNESSEPDFESSVFLKTSFSAKKVESTEEITDEQINEILKQTGKENPDDQLNCGACGYLSCREKAIAVIKGMAEAEMCVPYMRLQAEKRTDKIIESSPNGIVIINNKLDILHTNPAFRNMFKCSNAVVGKRISYLIDPEPFIQFRDGVYTKGEQIIKYDAYKLVSQLLIYKLNDVDQYVGLFVDITKRSRANEQLDELKKETIFQAQELMDHQVEMAQKMAKFLGESTAKGEELVEKLLKLTEDNTVRKEKGKDWLWDTYTSTR